MRPRALVACVATLASAAGAAHAAALGEPPAATTTLLGRSVHGRPIAVTRISSPAASIRRRVLVVGCVHGDECAGRAIVERLRRTAVMARGSELLLVRNLNPDGLALGRRQNAHEVDLNRNGSVGHRDLGPRGSRFHAGPRAWSEPEARAIRALVLSVRPDVIIWYHQPLARVDVPEAGWDGRARRYAQLTGQIVRPLPAYPGSLSRWANERVRAGSSFVVELPRGARLKRADAERHANAVLQIASLAP